MNTTHNKILVLAPHTDDAEFGCGGSIAKWLEEGKEVHCAVFSACKQSVNKEFLEDILISEVKSAAHVLGLNRENLLLFDYEVRTFNYHRQEILDDLIKLRASLKPDLIVIPSLNDVHQDHKTIAEEAVRAFKFFSIICYEMPWNNLVFNTTSFHSLEMRHVQTKIDAISVYKSQAHRPYSNPEFIKGLALSRGVQISEEYAEVFEVVRWKL